MKQFIVLLAIVCAGNAWAQEETTTKRPVEVIEMKQSSKEPYTYVDEPAAFPGGTEALKQYLANNLVYPKKALELGLEGRCYVSFVVAANGTISDIQLLRGVAECPECDAEALRLVAAMPAWIPGKLDGKIVASTSRLPVTFRIN